MMSVINTAAEFALSFTAFHAIFFFTATRVRRLLRTSLPRTAPQTSLPSITATQNEPKKMTPDENTVLSFKTIVCQRMQELNALESCYIQMRAECDTHDPRALESVAAEQALILQQVAVMAGEFEHLSEAICDIEKRWMIDHARAAV